MRPSNALALYGVRLRARGWQELLAAVGIAAGVALLFASQVSSSSLGDSLGNLTRAIAGKATLQLQARDPHGLPQQLLGRVRELPGVVAAAPVLEAGADAVGPLGRRAVELIGADQSLARLGGSLPAGDALRPFAGIGAVMLPSGVANTIGVTRFGQEVFLELSGQRWEAPLYLSPQTRQLGALSAGDVAITPLSFAQQITGLNRRVSRILVEPISGRSAEVVAELRTLAAGRLNVAGIDRDTRLFSNAATASNQSSALFAAIGALVGFLFAFNAMLFTVPQRRRLVLELRCEGFGPRTVIALLLLDAFMLGSIACALGLLLGEELSIHVLHANTAFLSLAFTLSSERVVDWQSIAVAVSGGMLATIVAVLSPQRTQMRGDHPLLAGGTGRGWTERAGTWPAALAGLLCLAAASVILLAAPGAAIPGMVLLVSALLLVLPLALQIALALIRGLTGRSAGAVASVAMMELNATGARAVAIAATGALALFGSVAIRGAHDDLLTGLQGAARATGGLADIWVAPAGSYDLMDTAPFAPRQSASLQRLPGVRAVQLYRGGLLDYGQRRALVIAPSPRSLESITASQVVDGDGWVATQRVRSGGWLVLSTAMAAEHRLHVGQAFTLPSPHPSTFRVAALSTNLGWAPGTIVMNNADYAHAWESNDASAYGVLLDGSRPVNAVVRDIKDALGAHSGLAVQTAAQHAAAQSALSRRALARLTQISTLIPIIAVLATAAAIGALIWQRRARLAGLRLEGLPRGDLWRTVLLQSLVLLSVGCVVGALFGLYGQQLADRALAHTIDFPVVHTVTLHAALSSLALTIGTAVAILAIPGYLAASAPVRLALTE